MKITAQERALRKIKINDNQCWIWTGGLNKPLPHGRGRIKVGDKLILVYKILYEQQHGPTPDDGLVFHHLCWDPQCCNPDHLVRISQDENTKIGHGISAKNTSKTHCPRGHEYTKENTYIIRSKGRAPFRCCKTCDLARKKA